MTAFRNNNIGALLGRFDIAFMHRLDCREILCHDRIKAPSAFLHIAQGAAKNADIRIGIHKYADIEKLRKTFVGKDKYSFDDYNALRFDMKCFIRTVMIGKIIYRAFHRGTGPDAFRSPISNSVSNAPGSS